MTNSHETNHAVKGVSCQPEWFRRLTLRGISAFQHAGCRVVLWFLQPETKSVAKSIDNIADRIRLLANDQDKALKSIIGRAK